MSEVIAALRWPRSFEALADYPSNDSQSWQNNLQGIAHQDNVWYLTNREALLTVPIGVGLQGLDSSHFHTYDRTLGDHNNFTLAFNDSDTLIARIENPALYFHAGALSLQSYRGSSFLYIPYQFGTPPSLSVEIQIAESGTEPSVPMIYALSIVGGQSIQDHNWRGIIHTEGDQGAWCAIDPVANRLYTSNFYGDAAGSTVDVYSIGSPGDPEWGTPKIGEDLSLKLIGELSLLEADGKTPAKLTRVQGGFITPRRHLYLVIDDGTGIVGFDLITGRRAITIPVDYSPVRGIVGSGILGKHNVLGQELEGACFFPDCAAPGIAGDIHLILWENGSSGVGEDFWLKHYAVTHPEDIPFI